MSSDPILGSISMFAGNFAPRQWAFCDGQLLPISQYEALFSVLGTIYGGDGRTDFALPDLRGRVPMHEGHGPGLTSFRLGHRGGIETVTLGMNQIPSHKHSISLSTEQKNIALLFNIADSNGNKSGVGAKNDRGFSSSTYDDDNDGTTGDKIYHKQPVFSGKHLSPKTITGSITGETSSVGNAMPIPIHSPFLCINFVICLEGIYPPRS